MANDKTESTGNLPANHGHPIVAAFKKIGLNSKEPGYRLIRQGLLETYTIGRRRYASERAIANCIDRLEQLERGRRQPRSSGVASMDARS